MILIYDSILIFNSIHEFSRMDPWYVDLGHAIYDCITKKYLLPELIMLVFALEKLYRIALLFFLGD
jgi:hypothetical protein